VSLNFFLWPKVLAQNNASETLPYEKRNGVSRFQRFWEKKTRNIVSFAALPVGVYKFVFGGNFRRKALPYNSS